MIPTYFQVLHLIYIRSWKICVTILRPTWSQLVMMPWPCLLDLIIHENDLIDYFAFESIKLHSTLNLAIVCTCVHFLDIREPVYSCTFFLPEFQCSCNVLDINRQLILG